MRFQKKSNKFIAPVRRLLRAPYFASRDNILFRCLGEHWPGSTNYDVLSGRQFLFGTRWPLFTMESSESGGSDCECGQIRPYQLEPYAARRPELEGEDVATGVNMVVRVGNTDW